MGKGAAINPEEGLAVSPVDGTVVSVFDTKHAIGIATDDGIELLIHIGVDTVNMKGKGFTQKCEVGQKVKAGDPLMEFDIEEIKKAGYENYFVDHTAGVYPTSASGSPWNAAGIGVKGDVISDLTEDMAAEQKARTTYDNILRLVDDPDVIAPIRFLREREIVHFQRFGEALENVKDTLDSRNFYATNPSFDR